MRLSATSPRLVAGAILALLAIIVVGTLSGPDASRPGPQSVDAASSSELKKLLASDAEPFAYFGNSAAIDGDTAVAGSLFHTVGTANWGGAAYVFQRDEGGADNWGEVAELAAADPEVGAEFGGSVAISSDTIIVGASEEDAGATNAGAAYVFERNEGGADNWGQVAKLAAPDPDFFDGFGLSVAISGDTAVVGAGGEDGASVDVGAAYVFKRDEGGVDNWGEVTKLTASDAQEDDFFGWRVALSDDTALIGAPGEATAAYRAGAAYVFERDEGGADNWGEVSKLIASDAERLNSFGSSLAINGDSAIVGAFRNGAEAPSAGAAYVFERDEGGVDNWGELKKLIASDPESNDWFGLTVAVSGNTVIVGAAGEDTGGSDAGAAYTFHRDEGGADNWGEIDKLSASDAQPGDGFGSSVATSGNIGFVGAPREDEADSDAGAAYVFDVLKPISTFTPTPTITLTLTITPTPTATPTFDLTDTDGDGCSNHAESGPDETLGGRRELLNFWDFYDTPDGSNVRDKMIDLFNDIFAVAIRFGASGDPGGAPLAGPIPAAPGYHTAFDRSAPPPGGDPWDTQAADGTIDLFNDIFGVAFQFGHSCAPPTPTLTATPVPTFPTPPPPSPT